MTSLYTAGHRTEHLTWPSLIHDAAYRASPVWVASLQLVSVPAAARAATLRSARGGSSTFGAMFGVLGRRAELSSMHGLVTCDAKRDAVANIQGKIWLFRKRLYMVSVDSSFGLPTLLAGIRISFIDSLAPFLERITKLTAQGLRRIATFPYGGSVPCFPVNEASVGTKSSTSINGIELLAAGIAGLDKWISAFAPTRLRAPLSRRSIGSHLELVAAGFADLRYTIAASLGAMGCKAIHRTIFLGRQSRSECYAAMFTDSFRDSSLIEVVSLEIPLRTNHRATLRRFGERLTATTSACIHRFIIAHHRRSGKYVAVALQRYADATGLQPTLLEAAS